MPWLLRDAKRERRIIEKIDQGDDRSAGILAASFLQDRLVKAIKVRMVPDQKIISLTFKGYGPLADFRSQIDIAYLLGIIEIQRHGILHVIREIRNRFAHRLDADDFNTNIIKDLCDKLFSADTLRATKAAMLIEQPHMADLYNVLLSPLIEKPETPRSKYINTVELCVFFLEMQTAFYIEQRFKIEHPAFELAGVVPDASPRTLVVPRPRDPQTEDRSRPKRVRQPRSSRP